MLTSSNLYIGVVEDRHDPRKIGRVRVRVLGLHSPDRKSDVPISSLPWATTMQPANASTSGSPLSQLVEGTWVVVMFMDQNMQDPLVLGSIPGLNTEPPNYEQGFSDPFGANPRWTGEDEPDRSLVSDEDRWPEHPTYDERGQRRITEIPRAKRYELPTVSTASPDGDYERSRWDEPDLRGGQETQYPYNSALEYEGGMLMEYDSTPQNTRITEMHRSGSYREILHDGSTTYKIVGDSYTVVLQDNNIFVQGDMNMTVEGSMRQLIEGDYILEVEGDYTQFVRGTRSAKIAQNDVSEIGNDYSTNIRNNHMIKCGQDQRILVDRNHTFNVGGDSDTSVRGDRSLITSGNSSTATLGKESILAVDERIVTTEGIHRFESVANIQFDTDSNMITNVSGSMTTDVGSTIDITAGGDITVVGGPNIHLNP